MANVFLSTEAYARLRAAKQENESFSDVVLHYVPQKINWDKYFGSCPEMDVEKLKAEVKKERNREFK